MNNPIDSSNPYPDITQHPLYQGVFTPDMISPPPTSPFLPLPAPLNTEVLILINNEIIVHAIQTSEDYWEDISTEEQVDIPDFWMPLPKFPVKR